jgi:hypothetical protein
MQRASPSGVRAYATAHGGADTDRLVFFAEADQGAARALGLQQIPALVAVENGAIAWVVARVLSEPAAVESIVRSWMTR